LMFQPEACLGAPIPADDAPSAAALPS
jgi:hypothetical protein